MALEHRLLSCYEPDCTSDPWHEELDFLFLSEVKSRSLSSNLIVSLRLDLDEFLVELAALTKILFAILLLIMLFLGLEAGLWNDLFSISTRRGEAEDSLSSVAFL